MKQLVKNLGPYLIVPAFFFILAFIVFFGPRAFAGITYDAPSQKDNFTNHTFFSATTTNATSTMATTTANQDKMVRIDGAKKVTMYFSRGGSTGANTGSSKFEVEVSPDGTNWYDFNRMYLYDVGKTATSTVWITAATSTVMAGLDLDYSAFHFLRCQVVEVTDGDHTCKASVQY